jgi:PUA domain protein
MQKGIRMKLIEQYPLLEPYIEGILPKKDNFKLIKCRDHVELLAHSDNTVLFVKPRDASYIPTLRLLHKYPFMLPHQQASLSCLFI